MPLGFGTILGSGSGGAIEGGANGRGGTGVGSRSDVGAGPGGLTPKHISGRYASSKRLNNVTLPPGKWFGLPIEVPTILTPAHAVDSIFLYGPDVVSRSTSLTLGGPPDTYSDKCYQASVGPGNIYLPSPGTWQIYNPSGVAVSFVQIDATDPAVAVRYIGEAGNHGTNPVRNNTLAASPTVTQVFAANRYRTAIIFNNTHAANGIRLAFGADQPSTASAPPQGLVIAAGVILQLTSTTLVKQSVQVMAITAPGAFECVEIF